MTKVGAVLRSAELCKPASSLRLIHEEPQFVPLQLPALKGVLEKGLMRGIIAEVNGRRSSGKMSVFLHVLAQSTIRGAICAVIDLADSFSPGFAAVAGVKLDRLVWVRCRGNTGQAIRATDLILHAGGFGVILLDLCEANAQDLNRIPLSFWYRFRRAVEYTPAILLLCAESAQAKACTFNKLDLTSKAFHWSGNPGFLLLGGLESKAALQKTAAVRPHLLLLQMGA